MLENPNKTYVIAKGWRIAAVAVWFVYGGLGAFLMWKVNQNADADMASQVIGYLMGSTLVIFFTGLLINAFFYRFEIGDGSIRSVDFWRTREMRLADIKGYQYSPKRNGTLIFLSESQKIQVMMFFENPKDFQQWLEANLKNLSISPSHQDMAAALSDERLGTSEEARRAQIDRARKWKKLSWVVAPFLVWGMFYPHPYDAVIWVAVLAPVAASGLLILFPALVRFDAPANSVYIPVSPLVVMPGLILGMRALLDWNVFDWHHFWIPFAAFTVCLFMLYFALEGDLRKRPGLMLVCLLYCAVYGSGAVVCLNGILDKSVPALYSAKVIGKRVSYGKHRSYYMTLSPWGEVTEQKEYSVFPNIFQSRPVGQKVTVSIKSGALNVPYYYIY